MDLDQETINQINRLVGEAVKTQLPEIIKKANVLNGAMAKIDEQFADFEKQLSELEAQRAAAGDSTATVAALQRKINSLTREFEAEQTARQEVEKTREEAENKARNERTFGELKSGLEKAGVKPEFLEIVAKVMLAAPMGPGGAARITFDDKGNPEMNVDGLTYPLDEGITRWAKTKESEVFRAPPGGNRPPTQPRSGLPQWDKPAASDEEAQRRAGLLLDHLGLTEALTKGVGADGVADRPQATRNVPYYHDASDRKIDELLDKHGLKGALG